MVAPDSVVDISVLQDKYLKSFSISTDMRLLIRMVMPRVPLRLASLISFLFQHNPPLVTRIDFRVGARPLSSGQIL